MCLISGMQIHTSRMTLSDDVNLEEFVMTKDEFSGADIKAICTEAGLLALRERRMKVTHLLYFLLCPNTCMLENQLVLDLSAPANPIKKSDMELVITCKADSI
jgi:SpoVK/Ycf46/Vps4 family AAA+-type ATPase